MKKLFSNHVLLGIVLTLLLTFSFFVPNLLLGKIPIPADAVIGLYHPFRDIEVDGFSKGKFPVKNPLATDPVLQTYPWRFIAIGQIKSLNLPYWNPYSFSGQPLAGNIQSAPFSIFNIFFLFMPFNYAWATITILSSVLTAVFMFLFLKSQKLEGKRLSSWAAILGAITLAFSGFYIAWLEWNTIIVSALWLPLILLSINKLFEGKKIRWLLVLCFGLTQTVFAGHAQTALYVYLASFAYSIASYLRNKNRQVLFLTILAYFVSTLIVLPQVMPALEFVNNSARSLDQGYYPNRQDWFIPLQNLLQLVIPDYFGNPTTYNYWGIWNYGEFVSFIGIAAAFLVLIALLRKKVKDYKFFTFLLIVSFLLAIKNPISLLPYKLNIPFISTLQPSRIIFLIDFALCVLSAFGLQIFLNNSQRSKNFKIALLLVVGVFSLLFITATFHSIFPQLADINPQEIALRNLILPAFIAIAVLIISIFSHSKSRKFLIVTLIYLIAIFELYRFSSKFLTFTKQSAIYPRTEIINLLSSEQKPFRVMTTDRRILHPNVSGVYNIESVDGYDPLYLNSYGQFVSSWQADVYDESSNSFGRIITPNKVKSPLVNLLNVKYILTFDELQIPGLIKVAQEGETKLYENKNVMPRIFFVNNVKKVSTQNEFNNLLQPDFILKNATSQDIEFLTEDSQTAVEIISYGDNYIKSKVTTKITKPLIISNVYDPGWSATIDGQKTPIFKANFIMQSILVPNGEHIIELKYVYNNAALSFVIALFGILSAVFVSFYIWLKKYQS